LIHIINKKLHLIGAGHYPDSTMATGVTSIGGTIHIITGADSSTFEGCYFSNSIIFGNSAANDDVTFITFQRCNLETISLNNYSNPNNSNNFHLIDCVVRGILSGGYAQNLLIKSCIFNYYINYISNAYITNSIFLLSDGGGYSNSPFGGQNLGTVHESLFENNIILDASPLVYQPAAGYPTYVQGCTFYNNIFVANYVFPFQSNIGINNIVNIPASSIFVALPGNAFSYAANYHLKPTCPGVGAGTDGTDIGLYGTEYPYKEGGVPRNPHIQSQNIIYDNINNILMIDVKTNSQDR
jgi:hypothetical protein